MSEKEKEVKVKIDSIFNDVENQTNKILDRIREEFVKINNFFVTNIENGFNKKYAQLIVKMEEIDIKYTELLNQLDILKDNKRELTIDHYEKKLKSLEKENKFYKNQEHREKYILTSGFTNQSYGSLEKTGIFTKNKNIFLKTKITIPGNSIERIGLEFNAFGNKNLHPRFELDYKLSEKGIRIIDYYPLEVEKIKDPVEKAKYEVPIVTIVVLKNDSEFPCVLNEEEKEDQFLNLFYDVKLKFKFESENQDIEEQEKEDIEDVKYTDFEDTEDEELDEESKLKNQMKIFENYLKEDNDIENRKRYKWILEKVKENERKLPHGGANFEQLKNLPNDVKMDKIPVKDKHNKRKNNKNKNV